jgi:hypothetical protein
VSFCPRAYYLDRYSQHGLCTASQLERCAREEEKFFNPLLSAAPFRIYRLLQR